MLTKDRSALSQIKNVISPRSRNRPSLTLGALLLTEYRSFFIHQPVYGGGKGVDLDNLHAGGVFGEASARRDNRLGDSQAAGFLEPLFQQAHGADLARQSKFANRNRLPLIFTIIVRAIIAIGFIFYICNYLSRIANALMITIGVLVVLLIVFSRWVKHRSITLERLFVQNLRSRDIAAEVHGKKRPSSARS